MPSIVFMQCKFLKVSLDILFRCFASVGRIAQAILSTADRRGVRRFEIGGHFVARYLTVPGS